MMSYIIYNRRIVMTNSVFWGEKRYYSLDYYIKHTFGEKLYKLSLDGGMTCPNRDGTLGTHGCIFCSAGGSGDLLLAVHFPLKNNLSKRKKRSLKNIPVHPILLTFRLTPIPMHLSLIWSESLQMQLWNLK